MVFMEAQGPCALAPNSSAPRSKPLSHTRACSVASQAVGGPSATQAIWSTLIQIVKTHPGFRITLPPHAHLRGGYRPARCDPGQHCCRCWWPSVPELRPTEVETAWSTASSTKILMQKLPTASVSMVSVLRCMLGMPEAYDSIRWPSNLPCPLICAWVAYGVSAVFGSVRRARARWKAETRVREQSTPLGSTLAIKDAATRPCTSTSSSLDRLRSASVGASGAHFGLPFSRAAADLARVCCVVIGLTARVALQQRRGARLPR